MRFSAVLNRHKGFILSVIIFLLVAFALTFSVISLNSLVIGDNFNWTPQNLVDITGPKVIRESYMGDIAVLSTFKTGFLFPLTYSVVSLNLPSTIVYPFLFYFLCMVSFYFLAKEFLKSNLLLILIPVLYVINPVTPYYFASLINAFSLVLLPLGLKFFVRVLREAQKSSKNQIILKNLAFTAFFLSLAVSANEQFILSIAIIVTLMVAVLVVVQYKNRLSFGAFGKSILASLLVIVAVFCIVNAPLFVSTFNVQKTNWSTYFQGPSSARFFTTIDYTYGTADPVTLLRFGGDSGTGFGQNSWYDSNAFTNIFGYTIFILFIASVVLLFLKKESFKKDRLFFVYTAILLVVAFSLILLIKVLPTLLGSAGASLDSLLKTWENPGKLRVVLLISALTTAMVIFGKLESLTPTKRNRILTYSIVIVVALSTIAYNSPWLVGYAGQTTLQGISDASHWDGLYQQDLANITAAITNRDSNQRAIILPYTHATELYAPPESRVFQIVSQVNEVTSQLIPEDNTQWSKTLGLFSIKSVAIKSNYSSNISPIFPNTPDTDISNTLQEIKNDAGFKAVDQVGDYQILSNKNALPVLYASSHYVFYDAIGTLKYAFNYVDFNDLPVFLNGAGAQGGGLVLPSYAPSDNYTLYALALKQGTVNPALSLSVNNNSELKLNKIDNYQNLTVYSGNAQLSAGDFVSSLGSSDIQPRAFNDFTLYSNSSLLGNYGSFTLDFKVNILQNGNYSFLGPRVMLDSGDKQYFIIIHDNGMIELATLENGVFNSGVNTCFVGYSLKSPQSQIDVKIERNLDEVKVSVNGAVCMTFTTEPKYIDLHLTSEQSTSKFSNITLTQQSSTRIFAVRQNLDNPDFTIQKSTAEMGELIVMSHNSDYMVVSQYLYNQLSKIAADCPSSEVAANIFFKGWLFNGSDQPSNVKQISIVTENQTVDLTLLYSSIAFSYLTLIVILMPQKARDTIWSQIKKINPQTKGNRNDRS